MMNIYEAMKDKQQKEFNEFPKFFAFDQKNFEKSMIKLGLNPDDTEKICNLGDTSGYYRRDDAQKLHDMFARHEKEMRDGITNDVTGDGFIFDMFKYELENHEYKFTNDVSEALAALGLTINEVNRSKKLKHGLDKAVKNFSVNSL